MLDSKRNTFETKRKSQQRKIIPKEEPNGNFRT